MKEKRYTVHITDGTIYKNCYIFDSNGETFRLKLSEIGVLERIKNGDKKLIINDNIHGDSELQNTDCDIEINTEDIRYIVIGSRILYVIGSDKFI